MQVAKFIELIYSIPLEVWENHLTIGKVNNIGIENIITRKYSHVAQCVVTGSKAISRVYVKLYRNNKNRSSDDVSRRVKADYQTLMYYNNKFKESSQFAVVKPLFILPDQHVLVTLEASGKTLSDIISGSCKFLISKKHLQQVRRYLTQAGAWLKYFQSVENLQSETYSIDSLIEYMNVRLKILTEDPRRHFPTFYWKKILEFVEKKKPWLLHKNYPLNPVTMISIWATSSFKTSA